MSSSIYERGLEPLGRFYAHYYGIVQSLEDPENMGRILVTIPEVKGPRAKPVWAIPRNQYGGPGYGYQCLPEVGDYVIISFRQGHPSAPYWEHGHFAKEEKPTEFIPPHVKGFITPGGIKVIIDDEKPQVKITLPSGSEVEMIDETITVSATKVMVNTDQEDQPFLRGNDTKDILNRILDALSSLGNILATDPVLVNMGSTVPIKLLSPTDSWELKIQAIKKDVDKILSEFNFGT